MSFSAELKNLHSFGGTDADSDPLLTECFEDHPAYIALKAGKKNVVLGRKGSGKTAVYKRIIQENPSRAIGINFTEYPWAHHELQKQSGVPEEQCFVESWKYFCLIQLCRIIASSTVIEVDPIDRRISHIKSFLKDTYGSHTPEPDRIFAPTQELRFKGDAKAQFGFISGGASVERVPMSHLPKIASEVNKYIRDISLGVLPKGKRYYILFDQLDHGFSTVSSEYRLRLIGLLLACKALNEHAASLGIFLTCAVFLRDDIYSVLQFEDKNKITQNSTAIIRWDTGSQRSSEPSLRSLMEKRFAKSLARETINWSDIFDEKKLMPGKQTKYNYMRERTFLRPRDMIKFCNEVLDTFTESTLQAEVFINSDIQGAQPKYSDYLYNELDDEIYKHVPQYKLYLEIIKDIGLSQFDKETFLSVWKSRSKKLGLTGEAIEALAALFDFSVIGYLAVGGASGGSGFTFKHKAERATFNETSGYFRVHWGLKETLGLKRS